MKLISSADALSFLAQRAPRPWVKRMLRWMIFDGELHAYFTEGRITPYSFAFVQRSQRRDINPPHEILEPKTDLEIEVAKLLDGKESSDRIEDEPNEWSEKDEPHDVGPGVFIYATELDWESGTLSADIWSELMRNERPMFDDDGEHFGSILHDPDFDVELSGLHFSFDLIEMLLPVSELREALDAPAHARGPAIGRPRKWDWEGALANIISIAQHPDGLPVGIGAQARIEGLIKDWFVQQTGGSPADSQIRERARSVIRSLSPIKDISPF